MLSHTCILMHISTCLHLCAHTSVLSYTYPPAHILPTHPYIHLYKCLHLNTVSLPEYTCPTHTYTCTNISLHLTHTNIAHHVITCTCTPMEVQASLQCANIETFCFPQEQGSWASWRSVSDLRRSLHAGVYCGTGPLQ